jgi:outer membrane cobalamin receptor
VYKNIGFNVTYRWQDAFTWNSSFVSGDVSAYGTLDAQVNYKMPKANATIKLGGSNVLNHYYQTSLGNPTVGGIYYVSILFDEVFK